MLIDICFIPITSQIGIPQMKKMAQINAPEKMAYYRFPGLVYSKNKNMKLRLAGHVLPQSIYQGKHLSLVLVYICTLFFTKLSVSNQELDALKSENAVQNRANQKNKETLRVTHHLFSFVLKGLRQTDGHKINPQLHNMEKSYGFSFSFR